MVDELIENVESTKEKVDEVKGKIEDAKEYGGYAVNTD